MGNGGRVKEEEKRRKKYIRKDKNEGRRCNRGAEKKETAKKK